MFHGSLRFERRLPFKTNTQLVFKISIIFLFAIFSEALAQSLPKDTIRCKGSVAATGLIQTGDENRTVFSLLSDIKIGNKKFEIEPLTSIAYSTKPSKQVEGEYFENIIVRYHQKKKFYPAIGGALEQSFLRKIHFRNTLSAAVVYNAIKQEKHTLKLAVGYSHENTKYDDGAFVPPINTDNSYSRSIEQLYIRLKGENAIQKLTFSYDLFYQAAFNELADNRWYLISNIDYAVAKHLAIRASVVTGFENFVATNVSQHNFRLTYGINFQF